MEWFSVIGPLERLGHGVVEVGDEREYLVFQVIHGKEVAAAQELAHQDAQPISTWLSHEACVGV